MVLFSISLQTVTFSPASIIWKWLGNMQNYKCNSFLVQLFLFIVEQKNKKKHPHCEIDFNGSFNCSFNWRALAVLLKLLFLCVLCVKKRENYETIDTIWMQLGVGFGWSTSDTIRPNKMWTEWTKWAIISTWYVQKRTTQWNKYKIVEKQCQLLLILFISGSVSLRLSKMALSTALIQDNFRVVIYEIWHSWAEWWWCVVCMLLWISISMSDNRNRTSFDFGSSLSVSLSLSALLLLYFLVVVRSLSLVLWKLVNDWSLRVYVERTVDCSSKLP